MVDQVLWKPKTSLNRVKGEMQTTGDKVITRVEGEIQTAWENVITGVEGKMQMTLEKRSSVCLDNELYCTTYTNNYNRQRDGVSNHGSHAWCLTTEMSTGGHRRMIVRHGMPFVLVKRSKIGSGTEMRRDGKSTLEQTLQEEILLLCWVSRGRACRR